MKDRVIPRAVVYFAGEAKEEEDGDSLATTEPNSVSNLGVVNENSIGEDVEELETDEEGDGDKKDWASPCHCKTNRFVINQIIPLNFLLKYNT